MRRFILFAFFFSAFFYSCTKIQTTQIGSELIPPVDGITTFDTSLLVTTATFEDENPAKVYKGDDHVIGTINNDPIFGKTTASAFFELKPTFFKFSFPGVKDSLQVDSAVLVLSFRGLYGDSTTNQGLSVYEISSNSRLKFDSAYNTRDLLSVGSLLGQKNIDLRGLDDSVQAPFEAAARQLRIALSPSFASRLVKDYDSTDAYSSDSVFRERFAGFAVMPTSGSAGQALIRVNLADTNTKLAIYYSSNTTGGTARQSAVSYFRYNTTSSRAASGNANLITRQRAGSKIAPYLNKDGNNDLAFVQTSPGTITRLRIPGLGGLQNAVIHRANLIMYQVPDNPTTDGLFSAPRYLLLALDDTIRNRKRNVFNDYIIDPSSGPNIQSFGGFTVSRRDPVTSASTIATYDFNLTRFVQGIVTRRDTSFFRFVLNAPSNDSIWYKPPFPAAPQMNTAYINPAIANPVATGRVQLAGGSHPNQLIRMRLRIIYSKL
ncbi:DUF4270 family protein [Segetibacter sp. 3557_3]|uniref:DUF4270 family protein n=1 Tax=Segetibacter sp. 3557_3 TaxID=2547429 RepID=UPI001404AB71|nr:DUF4270 family protein [Segetibacter sp. 3557_3]